MKKKENENEIEEQKKNEIGIDNGAEFKNKKFISFCEENKIKLIHGLP